MCAEQYFASESNCLLLYLQYNFCYSFLLHLISEKNIILLHYYIYLTRILE